MTLIENVVINGNVNPATMAARLRAAADSVEAAVAAMTGLGFTPPTIEDGNNIVITIPVRGNKAS